MTATLTPLVHGYPVRLSTILALHVFTLRPAGFGLGALNDADEDDIDIYEPGPSSRRGLIAYEAGDENRHHHSVERSAPGSQMNASSVSWTSQTPRELSFSFTPQSRNAPLQRFKNGDPVLQEFVLADTPVVEDKWHVLPLATWQNDLHVRRYPLDDVPSGWKPDPHRVWDKYNKENEPAAPVPILGNKGNLTIGQVRGLPILNFTDQEGLLLPAIQRGQALGETPLPSKPRSVFDYLSQKDRERLKSFIPPKNRPEEPVLDTPLPPPPEKPPASGQFVYPRLEPSVAKAALLGFKPFTSDPVKQARYTAYLKSQSEAVSDEDRLQLKQKPGQDLEHFQMELEEYAQAATVFKPLSGAMAGRFTTAKAIDHGPAVVEGLHTPSNTTPPSETKPSETKVEEPENAKTHAVKHGMYGVLTRETSVWVPAKLLCKRFGVKEPEIEAQEDIPSSDSKTRTDFEPETAFPEAELVATGADGGSSAAASQGASGDDRQKCRDINNVGLGEDETQGADILTYQRPERSIFKAIFASDEEDSDDEDQGKVEDTDPPEVSIPAPSGAPAQPSKKDVQMDIDEGPIDLATFRPKFIPRAERAAEDNPPSKKRKKDKEKRKSGKALVSFDAEEGEDSPVFSKSKDKDRERKKKRKPKDKESGKDGNKSEKPQGEVDGDGEDMWVEKAVPEVVQKMNVDVPSESPKEPMGETGRLSKRMRAEDFM